MKHLYYDTEGWATINVVDLTFAFQEPTFIIQGVEVTPRNRGQGIARRLMQQVLEDADREGATLMLSVTWVTEEDRGGLSHQQLWDWYTRLGFEPWDAEKEPDAMIRKPRLAVKP